MDPSISLIRTTDSFGQIPTNEYPLPIGNVSYQNTSGYEPKLNITLGDIETKYCDVSKFDYLNNEIKSKFNSTLDFDRARVLTNPFEGTTKSFLNNRAPIKLANIDFVFNITGHRWNHFNMISQDNFKFIDSAAGPGGYSQYFQYRFPRSTGVGMTLKDTERELDWNPKIVDMIRFDAQYGPSKIGDLLTDWKWFLGYLMNNYKDCNLLTCDGAFEIDDPTRIVNQEQVNSSLFSVQTVQTLAMPPGSNGMVKLFDANSDVTAGILYALSLNYKYISVFKPCTSRPANSERYVICMDKNRIPSDIANKALYQAAGNPTCNSIFKDLPQDFIDYLTRMNNVHIDSQIFFGNRILDYLGGKPIEDLQISTYLLDKLLALPTQKPVYIGKKMLKDGTSKVDIK